MLISLIIVNIIFVLLFKLYLKLTVGICRCNKHLVGKTVIVTGGNRSLGYETAKNLAERGARVIITSRNIEQSDAAKEKIIFETGNTNVVSKKLDLASLSSVREFADDILKNESRLDVLINNAATMVGGKKNTEDGLLYAMQVNHYGPFLLTKLLLPLLKSSSPSRIINLTSSLHTRGEIDFDNLNMDKENDRTFSDFNVFTNSKLFNLLTTLELATQLEGTGVTVNAAHPGMVHTDSSISPGLANLEKLFFKSPWEACQTSVYLASAPELDGVSGRYFSDCRERNTSRKAADKELAKKLWDDTERRLKIKTL